MEPQAHPTHTCEGMEEGASITLVGRKWNLVYLDRGFTSIPIKNCPWCGVELPAQKSLVKPIREELYAVERYAERIKAIHLSYEYYLRIRAVEINEIHEHEGKKEILGLPVVIHSEATDKEWWIETVL